MSRTWSVRLTDQAELDLLDISKWIFENFGARQAEYYAETILLAIEALTDGPETLGTKARDELAPGVRTLHIARHGRHARHFVVFRVADDQVLEVLRLLHDSMDMARHLPAANDLPH
ncbi:MAG: type II toxin-antitoxin system RelE/ParE family toxin [Pseudomonadota bacterium]|nr:type II toxin-antitoxin system RelE/ParE family toxin [Pseudomonadota bacterium]MDP1904963.1 type II toxin-antitoxin system RelE/ParE family toxin [Pseudomonadota bacterium]